MNPAIPFGIVVLVLLATFWARRAGSPAAIYAPLAGLMLIGVYQTLFGEPIMLLASIAGAVVGWLIARRGIEHGRKV